MYWISDFMDSSNNLYKISTLLLINFIKLFTKTTALIKFCFNHEIFFIKLSIYLDYVFDFR